jgi:hypothetical protein
MTPQGLRDKLRNLGRTPLARRDWTETTAAGVGSCLDLTHGAVNVTLMKIPDVLSCNHFRFPQYYGSE